MITQTKKNACHLACISGRSSFCRLLQYRGGLSHARQFVCCAHVGVVCLLVCLVLPSSRKVNKLLTNQTNYYACSKNTNKIKTRRKLGKEREREGERDRQKERIYYPHPQLQLVRLLFFCCFFPQFKHTTKPSSLEYRPPHSTHSFEGRSINQVREGRKGGGGQDNASLQLCCCFFRRLQIEQMIRNRDRSSYPQTIITDQRKNKITSHDKGASRWVDRSSRCRLSLPPFQNRRRRIIIKYSTMQ